MIAIAILGTLETSSAVAAAAGITNSGDDLRTGWYPNAQISPEVVTGGTFGQLWSTSVVGQVYSQPLVATNSDGSPESVIVTTEQNNLYALDPGSGAIKWSDNLGTPWNPADIGCGDITPYRGSTSTPVIDPSTNTVYLTYKTYDASGAAEWLMDARNVATGQEQSGFPVPLSGTADNFPSLTFDARNEDQRPGLLLMNGVVYAAFGGNCDYSPWQGWIFGVSASSGQITARWADNPSGDGAGIWQSGVGLTSDGPNTLLFVTGNGASPTTPASSSSMPDAFGESVVRLNVQSNGQLAPADFFAPFDATQLDSFDADFGAGALVGLPPAEFGTSSLPDLGVTVGKEGYVYLLNLENLGGFEQGPGAGDNVVQRLGPFGGVWGRAGVWPGDGGYVYIPTSTGLSSGGLLDVYSYGVTGAGAPSLSPAGSSSTAFGWGSGSPIITSDGTTSGSALIWMIWAANRSGANAQLQAYDPLPVGGTLQQVFRASIGTSANYSMPGVGDNGRLYVGTRDGKVLAFGSPVTGPVSGSAPSFPPTVAGSSSAPETLTLTANEPADVTGISSNSSAFTIGTVTLPASLATGGTLSVPITFSPTTAGPIAGTITVTTDGGTVKIPVSGTGQSAQPDLVAGEPLLSLGGTTVGAPLSSTVTFTNQGNAPLTITNVVLPDAPFSAVDAPADGTVLGAGQSVTIEIDFTPTDVGQFSSAIELDSSTTNQHVAIGVAGSAAAPPRLVISSERNDFGDVTIGTSPSETFTLTNAGGSDLTINKSKPPFGGEFAATTSLPEGTTIPAGQSVTETVQFTPTSSGPATGEWDITGNDGSGLQQVEFSGTGVTPPMLEVDPSGERLDFGNVDIGDAVVQSFTLMNAGGTDLEITQTSPPSGAFKAVSSLAAGATIPAGQSVTETVQFTPTSSGPATGEWDITGNDGSGPQQIELSGAGIKPDANGASSTTTTTSSPTPVTSPQVPTTTTAGQQAGTAHPTVLQLGAPTIWPAATTDAATRRSYITYNAVVKRISHFTLEREVSGRHSGSGCVAASSQPKRLAQCTRWVKLTTFTHADTVGVNQLWVVALMPGDRLRRGSYRLQSDLYDASGHLHRFITLFKIA